MSLRRFGPSITPRRIANRAPYLPVVVATAMVAALAAPTAHAQAANEAPVPQAESPASAPASAPAPAPLAAMTATDAATRDSHGPRAPQALVNYARVTSGTSVALAVNSVPLPEERQDDRSSLRRHLALMAVGVGAMLIGTELVDGGSGTVLVLGGAGLSLYSLYQILQ